MAETAGRRQHGVEVVSTPRKSIVDPPTLRLDASSQKLSPVTNMVLANQTGGENQTNGPKNVMALNAQAQSYAAQFTPPPQSAFANYNLVGTVWMLPNTYNLKSDQTSAVGSVDLTNATAKTFVQHANNTPIGKVRNCFSCHSPTAYSFQTPPPAKLLDRLIAISHVLGIGTPYEVPNSISGKVQLVPPAVQ
jgi:hypothetical protein